ncbi:MAG: hypothetical protein ACI8XO_002285 [Verrucomicrobiales bacterium]|jgi:hypothetical protein
MFKRVLYEEWHTLVPIISFILTFGVFLYFVVKAIRLKRDETSHMASLPLDFDEATNSKENQDA